MSLVWEVSEDSSMQILVSYHQKFGLKVFLWSLGPLNSCSMSFNFNPFAFAMIFLLLPSTCVAVLWRPTRPVGHLVLFSSLAFYREPISILSVCSTTCNSMSGVLLCYQKHTHKHIYIYIYIYILHELIGNFLVEPFLLQD